ncbi:MAG: hypothetical protein KC910_02920 [Candidatus Eremiobacteraeota bacterium]|nr:hypothetical protein [Candidatus Eremiobacteraeota bacterium]
MRHTLAILALTASLFTAGSAADAVRPADVVIKDQLIMPAIVLATSSTHRVVRLPDGKLVEVPNEAFKGQSSWATEAVNLKLQGTYRLLRQDGALFMFGPEGVYRIPEEMLVDLR